jgi:hypothetical protein
MRNPTQKLITHTLPYPKTHPKTYNSQWFGRQWHKEVVSAQGAAVGTTSQQASTAFLWKKKIKFLLPATTEEHIAHVHLLHKASNSLILMAINALVAICSIHLLW